MELREAKETVESPLPRLATRVGINEGDVASVLFSGGDESGEGERRDVDDLERGMLSGCSPGERERANGWGERS
jgi:hypothetical protein